MTSRRRLLALGLGAWLFGAETLALGGASARGRVPQVPMPEGMLERMRAEAKDGLVFVLPDHAAGREALGLALQRLLEATRRGKLVHPGLSDAMARGRLLVALHEVVYGVASAGAVGAYPWEGIVLLGPDGQRLAGGRIDLGSAATMAVDLRRLLDHEPHASARRDRIDPDELQSLRATLSAPVPGIDRARDRRVIRSAAAFAPHPLPTDATDDERRQAGAVLRAMEDALQGSEERLGGQPTVHGVTWAFERYDPCPPCGMMAVEAHGRRFLDFVAGRAGEPAATGADQG